MRKITAAEHKLLENRLGRSLDQIRVDIAADIFIRLTVKNELCQDCYDAWAETAFLASFVFMEELVLTFLSDPVKNEQGT